MNTVTALRALGYSVTADGDTLRLASTGASQPEPAVVRPLLAELRAAKAQALVYLRDEAIPVMYQSETAEEAWWAAVFAVRGMADPTAPDPDAAEAVSSLGSGMTLRRLRLRPPGTTSGRSKCGLKWPWRAA
jgi:hypothetical protein